MRSAVNRQFPSIEIITALSSDHWKRFLPDEDFQLKMSVETISLSSLTERTALLTSPGQVIVISSLAYVSAAEERLLG
jgi:hypothetical protein